MRGRTAVGRLPLGAVRLSDGLLDCLVLVFAAWTAIYHVSLAAGVGTRWAGLALAAAVVPCAWLAFGARNASGPYEDRERRAPWTRGVAALGGVNLAAALSGAALYAFTDAPWLAVWSLWVLAAGAAVAATVLALARRRAAGGVTAAKHSPRRRGAAATAETAVVLAWAVALAVLSLFIVNPDGDDTQYIHLAAWVAAHGEFPLRDTLFSPGDLPAIIFPPVASVEALAGTIARVTGLAVPDLVYLVVTPLASALAVLSLWRLLRTWRVPMVGLALSVSTVYLLMATEEDRMLGRMFVGRLWQGKIVFLAVLVPLLYALLHEYAEAPTRRRLVLLAAAGAAGVGLTSSATFLVPLIAAGAALSVAARSPRQAAAALVATVAYPLLTAAGIAVVGARHADVTQPSEVLPENLVAFVLGDGVFAFLTLAALLVAPVVIRRPLAGAMTATTVLVVALLYAPPVPPRIFELTRLGEVQWRWMWVIPTAALVGALATGLVHRAGPPVLRAAPALLLALGLAVLGTPVWSAEADATLAKRPAWKREPATVTTAERIVAHLRPRERVLAPRWVTETVLVMSGTATAVAPRRFYTEALEGVGGAHARERLLLMRFAEEGLRRVHGSPEAPVKPSEVVRALRVVRVDLACVPSVDPAARRLLVEQGYSWILSTGETAARRVLLERGYSPAVSAEGLVCLRAPAHR